MAWLALAMESHWKQVMGMGSVPPRSMVRRLRSLGGFNLAASLALCLCADHASMAALVWVMVLSAAAWVVVLVLAWRPHWLRIMVCFGRQRVRR